MQSRSRLFGTLTCGLLLSVTAAAQHGARLCLVDPAGNAVPDVAVSTAALHARTNAEGCIMLDLPAGTKVRLEHAGFATTVTTLTATTTTLVLPLAPATEAVQVTAARVPLPLDATASSVRTLGSTQLHEAAGLTLDDALRQVAGFQLFRRTSGWVANPTIQGTSLRGLGSTAASRTLVLSDQVPLNDAFGGWVHWNEMPELATESVTLMRGGASDLYGSSAIGGVIDVVPRRPQPPATILDVAGASRGTSSLNGLYAGALAQLQALAALSLLHTDGYVQTAPALRGAVDVPSNVHSQAARVELHPAARAVSSLWLRGNLLNEVRSNGTPLQTNATRLWRYSAGYDLPLASSRLLLRLYGDDQSYRQSFSAINTSRSAETLTRLQRVPSQQLGATAQWARSLHRLTVVAGTDVADTRATDAETPVKGGVAQPRLVTTSRQRATGLYGELLYQPAAWSFALSSRYDNFRTFDAQQYNGGAGSTLPTVAENVFDPRLGVVRRLGEHLSLSASAFRAFRGPTMNELYRTGQVGQQITLANPSLRSERATGTEAGALWSSTHLALRGSYFWTQVNRPIAAVTIGSTATTLTEQRENLGQIVSQGAAIEWQATLSAQWSFTGGYQYAHSTVTQFQPTPALVGKWTAQVPRNTADMALRWSRPQSVTASLSLRLSGQQFDDSANHYRLAPYQQVDLFASRALGRHASVYATVQNLVGKPAEAGRTPLLTLGLPRTALLGIRWNIR
ncbi:MAG: TonB-dependent receptor [Acidobacteriota bacterium]|nr:TonB-dependent receptor [Acidobacteriota bacterium]